MTFVRHRRSVAAALLSLVIGTQAVAAEAPGRLATGPENSIAHRSAGPGLQRALRPVHPLLLEAAPSALQALHEVASGRTAAAFVQRDLYENFLAKSPEAAKHIEYYPGLPACLLTFVRKDTWPSFGELAVAAQRQRIVVDAGLPGSNAGVSVGLLRGALPALDKLELENRGGARALGRLLNGDADAMIVPSHELTPGDLLHKALSDGLVSILPLTMPELEAAVERQRLPYRDRTVVFETGTSAPGEHRLTTLCTNLGVVVDTRRGPEFSEAVARAVMSGALEWQPNVVWETVGMVWQTAVALVSRVVSIGCRLLVEFGLPPLCQAPPPPTAVAGLPFPAASPLVTTGARRKNLFSGD
ncbi:MAG TPA: hypothetical protein VD995_16135 [Azospirillum sp.]|nr:hypothetical protein [Azospirillum sp.]